MKLGAFPVVPSPPRMSGAIRVVGDGYSLRSTAKGDDYEKILQAMAMVNTDE